MAELTGQGQGQFVGSDDNVYTFKCVYSDGTVILRNTPCPSQSPYAQAGTGSQNIGTLNQDKEDIQPSVIFQNNMIDGFKKFGVSFLQNRRNVNVNTLNGLASAGTYPKWQQLLVNKISYIDMLLSTGGIEPSVPQVYNREIPLGQTAQPVRPVRPSISVPPVNDYSNVDAYCDKYYQAYISGNGGAMNTIAATVASMYNIDNAQAKALLAERCLCKGYELPIDEPTDDPISFDCSFVTQEWCIKFNQAFAFGKDSPNMQGTVIPFITYASGYGVTLTYDQAYGLLQKCCRDGNTGDNPCNDPNWVNLAMGGTIGQPNYNYGKNNYCDRCRAGNGSFPVSWNPNTGNWYYDQANGTDYCSCCEPSNQSGDYSCENVPEEFCIQFRNASAFGQPQTAIPNVVSTFTTYAAGIGFTLSYNQAYDILKRCCEQGSTRPTRPTSPTLPPLPTKPIQTQIKNNTNISSSTRGFDGEFMFGDY